MSQATYIHVGDPSGTPSADILFTAVENGAPGNDLTVTIATTTVDEDVAVTVDLENIEIVAKRTGGDSNYADATTLAAFVPYLNAIPAFAEKAVATLINTASGAKLWGTSGAPASFSGGDGDIEDITVEVDPVISFAEIQPSVEFGVASTIQPAISFAEIEPVVAYGTGVEINPEIDVDVYPVVTASREAIIEPSISVSVGIQNVRIIQTLVSPEISVSVSLSVIRPGLTVCDVVRDILMQWGLEIPCEAPLFAKRAAFDTLNQAMQTVWNQAKDRNYWTRQTVSVTYPSGGAEVVLDNTVQNVIGHVRLDGRPLIPLSSRYEAEHFGDVFGEAPVNPPTAYFIDRSNQSGNDPCRVSVMLVPPPDAEKTVSVDAVVECPRYSINDIDMCPVIPIPHKYVESLLMPVARFLSMQSHLFINEANREAIAASYEMARSGLEEANPAVSTTREKGGKP